MLDFEPIILARKKGHNQKNENWCAQLQYF